MFGLESLIAFGTPVVSGLFADVIKNKSGELLKRYDIDLKIPIGRQLEKASREYVKNYADRHGTLKTVCVRMDSPVKLDEIYTAVQLLERSDIRYFKSADALQDLFRQVGKRGFEFREPTRQNGLKVANQHQCLMVLGSPGIGKSTFLRKVGLEALKGKNGTFQHACIPVLIVLRQFDNSKSIEQLISEEFSNCGFEEAAALTQAALEKGKLLILLDGLDEVPREHENKVIDQIQNLVDRYSDNRFIASCRIAAYKGGFTRFKDVIVAAFEDTQIEEFIRHWFAAEPAFGDACWSLLKQPEYAAAKELAQTPLLLTLLCAVYNESQDFPKNRAAVYGEALDVLLKKWSAEKRLQRDPIYKELSSELERILLSEIAFDSFESDRLFFSKSEVVDQIRKFLIDNLNAPKHLDGEAVLEAIEVQQGLLVERARETYSFSHLTLQEYLTAKYIVDNNQINWMVEHHLTNKNWREVFLLVAGQMAGRKGADDLLLAMEQQAKTYINSDKLIALLNWADQATAESEGNYKPAAKRVAAIYFAHDLDLARALDHDHDLTRVRDHDLTRVRIHTRALDCALDFAFDRARARARTLDLDHDLNLDLASTNAHDLDLARVRTRARAFALALEIQRIKFFKFADLSKLVADLESLKSEVPNNEQSNKVRQAFAERIQQLWFTALQLDPAIVNLSEEESQALADYFFANERIVQCKEAAVRVSGEVWEAIESRMLKV